MSHRVMGGRKMSQNVTWMKEIVKSGSKCEALFDWTVI